MWWKRNERGTAAVEFAVVLPVLLIVILSLIDFGRYLYVRVSITNASVEVADAVTRGLILDSDPLAIKRTKILNLVSDVSPDIASFAQLDPSATLSIDPMPTPCPNSGNSTTVILSSTFQSISPLAVFFKEVKNSTTIRCLR